MNVRNVSTTRSGQPIKLTTCMPTFWFRSLHSLESDPVLSYISSKLAHMPGRQATLAPVSPASPPGTAGLTERGAAQGASPAASAGRGGTASNHSLATEVQPWRVSWDDITPIRLIGTGSFGRVYEVICQPAIRLGSRRLHTQWGHCDPPPPHCALRSAVHAGVVA